MHQNAPFLSRVSMTMHAEHDMVFLTILSVCPSVCLSVQYRYCVKTNGHIVTPLRHSCSSIILVLSSATAVTKFQGVPLSGGVRYKAGGKICPNIAIYLGKGTR